MGIPACSNVNSDEIEIPSDVIERGKKSGVRVTSALDNRLSNSIPMFFNVALITLVYGECIAYIVGLTYGKRER